MKYVQQAGMYTLIEFVRCSWAAGVRAFYAKKHVCIVCTCLFFVCVEKVYVEFDVTFACKLCSSTPGFAHVNVVGQAYVIVVNVMYMCCLRARVACGLCMWMLLVNRVCSSVSRLCILSLVCTNCM